MKRFHSFYLPKKNSPLSEMWINLRTILFFSIFPFLLLSCSNETPLQQDLSIANKNEIVTQTSELPQETMKRVSPEIAAYYNNLKTIMYATDALVVNDQQLRSSSLEENNPIISKLNSLVIEDEETRTKIGFYDLPIEQRQVFIEFLLAKEAEDLTMKCTTIKGLNTLIQKENEITEQLLREEEITLKTIGQSTELRSNGSKSLATKRFFKRREELISNDLHPEDTISDLRSASWVISGNNVPLVAIPSDKVRNAWAGIARRGDFLLALPVFEDPSVINNKNNQWGKWGHAGILCRDVNYNTLVDAKLTLESYPPKNGRKDGVQWYRPIDWQTYHYVMGICSLSYKWKWKGLKSGFYKVRTPVSNPGALADEAMKYIDCGYANDAWDFITAKSKAERHKNKKFTCTSLVWYCSKQAYNINVSSWYSTLVSVTGLFTDDCTYIREKIH